MESLERHRRRLAPVVLKILFPDEKDGKKDVGDVENVRETDQEGLASFDSQCAEADPSDEEQVEPGECSRSPDETRKTASRSQRKRLRRRKLNAAKAELRAQRAGRFVGPLIDGELRRENSPPEETETADADADMPKLKRRKLAKRLKQAKDSRGFVAEEVNGELVIRHC